MDTNEFVKNEEVIGLTEEIAAGFGKGLKIAAGIGLAVVVSGITYKFVVKPLIAKIKTKKNRINSDFGKVVDFKYDSEKSEEN